MWHKVKQMVMDKTFHTAASSKPAMNEGDQHTDKVIPTTTTEGRTASTTRESSPSFHKEESTLVSNEINPIEQTAVQLTPVQGTIQYTRQYLEHIVTQTVKENLPIYLQVIASASEDYLHLFDTTIGRKKRSGLEISGHYLPSCLILELKAILCRQYEDPITEECQPVSALVNSEEKLQILCLYLLWTNELVSMIGTCAIHNNLHGLSHSHGEDLSLTSRWNILYQGHKRYRHQTQQYVIDLRYLHHHDLILPGKDAALSLAPSPVLNLKGTIRATVSFYQPKHHKPIAQTPLTSLLRSNEHTVSVLVQSDAKHFDIAHSEYGVYITYRVPSIHRSKYQHDEVLQDFTLELFCKYSLHQAALLAHKLNPIADLNRRPKVVVKYVSVVFIQHDLSDVDLSLLSIIMPPLPRKKHELGHPPSPPKPTPSHVPPPFPRKRSTIATKSKNSHTLDSPSPSPEYHSSSSCSEHEEDEEELNDYDIEDESSSKCYGFELKVSVPH